MLDFASNTHDPRLETMSLKDATREFRRALVLHAITQANFSTAKAARRLQIDRSHLTKLMRQFGFADPAAADKALTEPARDALKQTRAAVNSSRMDQSVQEHVHAEVKRKAERKVGGPVQVVDLDTSLSPEQQAESLF